MCNRNKFFLICLKFRIIFVNNIWLRAPENAFWNKIRAYTQLWMIWNLLIIGKNSVNLHCYPCLIIRIAIRHRRIRRRTIFLLIVSDVYLFKLIIRLTLTTTKIFQVQLVGISFSPTHRLTHGCTIILRYFLVLHNNILRKWLSKLFFLLDLTLILHNHLLSNLSSSMVPSSNVVSFLCSLIIWVLMNIWLLIYLFKPSIKRHWIGLITTSRLIGWRLVVILLWRCKLVLRMTVFTCSSCKSTRGGVAYFHLRNLGAPWSRHHNLRWHTVSLVASYRGVMNASLSSKGWLNHFLKLWLGLRLRLLILP